MTLRCPQPGLVAALEPVAAEALVFVTDPSTDDEWEAVLAELTEAFQLTQAAVAAGQPVVYVVGNDDLLGRNGAGKAMVATGLLSAARTLALEQLRAGLAVNVVALDDSPAAELVAVWCERAVEQGVTGQVLHLGGGHLGKTRP